MSRILPILFNTEMVKAILGGRKTVTRRIVKKRGEKRTYSQYNPGDILYVRETWAFIPCIDCNGDYAKGDQQCYDFQAVEYDDGDNISDGCFVYRADCKNPGRITWRPSIHMPKQAARIWLKVTDVRVERLQDIDGKGCISEGVEAEALEAVGEEFIKGMFQDIWDGTIKKSDLIHYGWDANPCVWVIEFERCEKPETL